MSTGTWRDTYGRRGRKYQAIHQGGPVDGAELTITGQPLPQFRHWAPAGDRRQANVKLARYVLHVLPDLDTAVYRYTGTYERTGPVPGDSESPAWSQ
jgi:hypothetical protein